MKTATKIADVKRAPEGVISPRKASVYRLSEPYEGHAYLFVSTTVVLGAPETYAFPCTRDGKVISWSELPCSMKGDRSHAEVLGEAGYTIVETTP